MLIAELIERLQEMREEHGNLPVFVLDRQSRNVDGYNIFDIDFQKDIEYFDEEANDVHADGFLIC